MNLAHLILFAADAAPEQQQGDPNGLSRVLFLIAGTVAVFYFLIWRPQKQRERELRDSVQNVKENDRIVTIGGIHGIVTNIQRDAERATIRVDESNGTKLRINLSAISRVVTTEDHDGSAATKSS